MEILKKQRTQTLLIPVFILWNFSLFCAGQFGPVDDIPPFVLCGPDIVRQSPLSSGGLNVNFTECTATDDSGFVILIASSHSPGDFFPFGTTLVTYTFTDLSGNTETGSFNVTVNEANDTPPDTGSAETSSTTVAIDQDDTPPCVDPVGNEVTGSSTVAFDEVDEIPPLVQCGPDIVRQSPFSSDGLNVNFTECTATDDSGFVILIASSHIPGDFFPFGTTLVTYTFTDPVGNVGTGSFTITIEGVDDIPPLVHCGPDIVRQAPFSSDGLHVNFTECTASDDSGFVVLIARSHIPGDFFPFGTTLVTYTFTDPAGNVGTGSFTITIESVAVMDSPAFNNCPTSSVTAALVPGESTITVQLPVVTAADNLQLETVPSNNQFQVGVTRVIVHATDSSGSTAICTYNVIVFPPEMATDVTPPIVCDCPEDPLKYRMVTEQSSAAQVSWREPFSTDESCLPVVINSSHSPGDPFLVGNTRVTYNFTDSASNLAQCIFIISVVETNETNVFPVFSFCPSSVRHYLQDFSDEVIVTWPEPDIDYVNRDVTVTQTHFSGDTFKIGRTEVTYRVENFRDDGPVCSFYVDVIDIQPPVITLCPSMRRIQACRGSPTATWVEPTAQDNSGSQVAIIQSHIPGESVFKEGTTTVSYIFSDIYNNTAICSFNVHRDSCQCIPRRTLYFAVYISWGIICLVFAILISIRICFYVSNGTTEEGNENDISLHEVRMT